MRDCVLALEARRGSAGYRRDLDYWAERLSGMPPGPGLASVAAEPDDSGGLPRTAITGSLAPSRWRSLRDRAASLGVSPTSLVLTLFAEALARTEQRDAFSLALTTNSRPWLPREVDDVAGPFTSTTVFVAENTLGGPLDEAAKAVHHRLWQDLAHTAVSGVEVMRELRARDREAGQKALPVVFTSLLDVGPRREGADHVPPVSYAVSQTSGVALDHQMWEQDGALHFRWDVAADRFPSGAVETTFAAFVNALHALCADTGEVRLLPLNELQKAYYVSRAAGTGTPQDFDGCQVYHSFEVRDLDVGRLEEAWLRMVAAYDVLRTEVTHDGRLRVRPDAPNGWRFPSSAFRATRRPTTRSSAIPPPLMRLPVTQPLATGPPVMRPVAQPATGPPVMWPSMTGPRVTRRLCSTRTRRHGGPGVPPRTLAAVGTAGHRRDRPPRDRPHRDRRAI